MSKKTKQRRRYDLQEDRTQISWSGGGCFVKVEQKSLNLSPGAVTQHLGPGASWDEDNDEL